MSAVGFASRAGECKTISVLRIYMPRYSDAVLKICHGFDGYQSEVLLICIYYDTWKCESTEEKRRSSKVRQSNKNTKANARVRQSRTCSNNTENTEMSPAPHTWVPALAWIFHIGTSKFGLLRLDYGV